MIVNFVSSLIFWWILRAQLLSVNGKSTCEDEILDKSSNQILSDGSLNFSLNLYKELKSGKNVFFSPFSIRMALAMTTAGAKGITLTQMNKALALDRFQSEDQMNTAFQSDLSSFCPNSNYALSTANRIYVQKDFLITKSFSQTLEKFYLSNAENVNFRSDANGVAKNISNWVEEQTNGTIKDLIPPGTLSSGTLLVLVNAINFKGKWKTKFDPADTLPQTFNLADGRKVKVPTMYAHSNFAYFYSDALKSQILQLNYEGDHIAMYLILPEKEISLSNIQNKINSKNANDFMAQLLIQEVEVYLPKFKASYRERLNEHLKSLGMVDAFGLSADLTRMTIKGGIYVSEVIHQAYVAVDEEGTTAASATYLGILPKSMLFKPPPPIQFRVDRPCVYVIYDLKFKQILFMGNLDDPSSKS